MLIADDFLGPRQAAEFLGLNEQTVRRLAREGALPASRVGGVWRFRKTLLTEWQDKRGGAVPSVGRRILVVDDEKPVLAIMESMLNAAGFDVALAVSGEDALAMMHATKPDLVFLDLVMPKMNGAQVLAKIRADWGMIPVVVLTGYPENDILVKVLEYSPVMLLKKPVLRDQLLEAARLCLKSETAAPDQNLPSP